MLQISESDRPLKMFKQTKAAYCGVYRRSRYGEVLFALASVLILRVGTPASAAEAMAFGSASHHHPFHSHRSVNVVAPENRNKSEDIALLEPKPYECCYWMCRCNDTYADCSQNFGNLTFIPVLPQGIKYLNFSFNGLTAIPDEEFFSNATQILGLDLSHNDLVYVAKDAFKFMTKLQDLAMNYNRLNYTNLDFLFGISSLKRVDLIRCVPKLGPLPIDYFYLHPMPYLETLNLHDNLLGLLNMTAFKPLRRLKHLGLGHNAIYQIFPDYMPRLSALVLHSNRIYEFPETCGTRGAYFPELKELYLDNNAISSLVDMSVCLRKVELLEVSRNALREILSDTFNSSRFPSLRMLFFRSNKIKIHKIHRRAFSNPNLKLLALLNNGLVFSRDDTVHPDAFVDCPSLLIIQLNGNIFAYIRDDKFQRLFGQVPSLKELFLSYCQIYDITADTFKGLTNITSLYMSGNALTEIPDGAFDSLVNLERLFINENRIFSIGKETFDSTLKQHLTAVDLSANPFVCDCSIKPLQHWLISNPVLFKHSHSFYRCVNMPHTSVTAFIMSDQACLLSQETCVFVVVTASLILVTLILASSLFRFRWHIRLLMYEAFQGRQDRRRLYLQGADWKYDVYVSYAEEDQGWVRRYLMPELESGLNLRLCVKDRDFPANEPEVRSIEKNLEASKKMLLLFSSNFSRDEVCEFELSLCVRHAMDHGDRPLVACLHDIPSRDLTASMLAVMKTSEYFQWDCDPDVTASFWGRLALALDEILPPVGQGQG